jgi:hypothetical protein
MLLSSRYVREAFGKVDGQLKFSGISDDTVPDGVDVVCFAVYLAVVAAFVSGRIVVDDASDAVQSLQIVVGQLLLPERKVFDISISLLDFKRYCAVFLHTTKLRCVAAFVVQDKEKTVKSGIARISLFLEVAAFQRCRYFPSSPPLVLCRFSFSHVFWKQNTKIECLYK